jgi:hypothetical protein
MAIKLNFCLLILISAFMLFCKNPAETSNDISIEGNWEMFQLWEYEDGIEKYDLEYGEGADIICKIDQTFTLEYRWFDDVDSLNKKNNYVGTFKEEGAKYLFTYMDGSDEIEAPATIQGNRLEFFWYQDGPTCTGYLEFHKE